MIVRSYVQISPAAVGCKTLVLAIALLKLHSIQTRFWAILKRTHLSLSLLQASDYLRLGVYYRNYGNNMGVGTLAAASNSS